MLEASVSPNTTAVGEWPCSFTTKSLSDALQLTLVKDIKADTFLIGTGLRDLIELREFLFSCPNVVKLISINAVCCCCHDHSTPVTPMGHFHSPPATLGIYAYGIILHFSSR